MGNIKKVGSALILASFSACLSAGELPNTENMQGLQFNFSTPGARSLGMGSAFIGRADDATAAYANPAGLTSLFSPEISAEYRRTSYTTQYTNGGEYPDDLTFGEDNSNVNDLSYLSYVHPFEKLTVAVYRHQLMDFKAGYETGSFSYRDFPEASSLPTQNSAAVDIVSYGLSGAYRINEKLSLGASFVYYDFSMDGAVNRLENGSITNSEIQSGNDNSWGVTLGAIFSMTDRLNLGLVYRSMPDFNANNQLISGTNVLFENDYKFKVPDVYGAGLSFQANDNLTLNFDILRVEYADLASPVFDAFYGQLNDVSADDFSIDSGTELHFGVEYVLSSKPLALRTGIWTDPGHTMEYNGPVKNADQAFFDAMFQGTDNQTHWSVGFGYFFGTRGQIDMAADFSDLQDTYSISAVFRFE